MGSRFHGPRWTYNALPGHVDTEASAAAPDLKSALTRPTGNSSGLPGFKGVLLSTHGSCHYANEMAFICIMQNIEPDFTVAAFSMASAWQPLSRRSSVWRRTCARPLWCQRPLYPDKLPLTPTTILIHRKRLDRQRSA
jgi:hypothetical protein